MILVPLADIAGDNASHQLAASGHARTILFTITTGTGSVRVGSSAITSSKGAAVPTTGLVLPQSPDHNDSYALASTYVYVPTSTTVSISYVPA